MTAIPPPPDATPWPEFHPGSVWLVGAGPGDPGLLTLHGLRALREADVIVHDALSDARLLGWARPGARIEPAGKRAGRPSARQEDITRRLVTLARRGLRVLRLKGGDPFVFGRGGEEALALAAQGVPFRIVPGITAGIGGLAAAGIPVTHRDVNQAVAFVTGHDRAGAPPAVDWAALARGAPVIVCYMGLRNWPAIAQRLLAAGRPPEEPVAAVANAARPDQAVVETVLGRSAAVLAQAGLDGPVILCIGGVVALGEQLRRGMAQSAAAAGAPAGTQAETVRTGMPAAAGPGPARLTVLAGAADPGLAAAAG